MKNIIKLKHLGAFLAFCVSFNSACGVTQLAKKAETAPTTNISLNATDLEIEQARALVKNQPDQVKSHLRLADSLLKKVRETGDYSLNREAETAIEDALAIDGSNFAAKIMTIQIYLSEHKFREALDLAELLEKDNPSSEPLMAAVTDAKTELGLYDEAVIAAQRYVDFRPNANSYVRIANLRSLHGDTEGAIAVRKLALKSADPVNKELLAWHHSQLGNEYFNVGQYAAAEKEFETALEIFPNYHWAVAGKGKVRAAQNDFKTAETLYRQLSKNTQEADRVFFLSDVLEKQGKHAESKKISESFIQKRLSDGGDEHRIALFWADKNINLDKALEIARLDRKNNSDLLSSDTLAWCLFKKGEFKEAKKFIAEAMRLKTKSALFYYHAGMIENGLGNKKEAVRYLELSLKTNASFDLIQADVARKTLKDLAD